VRILITNTILAGRSGTEVFVAQLAEELFRRGHQPLLYAPLLGPTALALRRQGIAVFDRVANIAPAPDVIHAHHLGPALAAIAAFPGVPALFVSHDATREQDRPPAHPQLRRVMAVSRAAAEQWGEGRELPLLRNAVDLARFPPRPPLPPRPSRLLVVAKHEAGVAEALAAAARAGLAAEAIGHALGRVTADLSAAFAAADIVVASGRSALEAAASGCAVILAEGGRFGGPLDAARLGPLLDDNLGLRTLRAPLSPAALDAAIAAYDPAGAAEVARLLRAECSLAAQAERLVGIYAAMLEEPPPAASPRDLATLIEAYVPTHGDLPWRVLVQGLGGEELTGTLDAAAALRRLALPADAMAAQPAPGLPERLFALAAERDAARAAEAAARQAADTAIAGEAAARIAAAEAGAEAARARAEQAAAARDAAAAAQAAAGAAAAAADAEAATRAARTEAAEARASAEAARAEAAEALAAAAAARAEAAALRDSTSWRVTAPLRALRRWLAPP
jgi:hypothetical protein